MKTSAGASLRRWFRSNRDSEPVSDIADGDLLYRWIVSARGGKRGHKAYFEGGQADALRVARSAERWLKRKDIRVLEFASGYGRVTRHLKGALPQADITASDIHPAACAFIRERLGVKAMESAVDPAALSVGGPYDFVFVLSLFSHLPDRTFAAWLAALCRVLAPGGILLFTTHGDRSRKRMAGLDRSEGESGDGWTYYRISDQSDLDVEDYGTLIVTPRYVTAAVEQCDGVALRSFNGGAWLGHQDGWAIQKSA